KTESRGYKAIEHTLTQARRQFSGDAVTQQLLNKTVAAGQASGNSEMNDNQPGQSNKAHGAGAHTVQKSKLAQQSQSGRENVEYINDSAWAQCGDDGNARCGCSNYCACLLIQRCHQLTLCKSHQIGAVDNFGQVTLQIRSAAREMRHS